MSKILVVLFVLCAALGAFAAPVVDSIEVEGFISTSVDTLITVVGTGFTGASEVKISGVECQSLNVIDDTKVECYAQPGLGQGNKVQVTVGGETASADIVDFAPAQAQTCAGASYANNMYSTPNNPAVVTICGVNFGSAASTSENGDWTGVLKVNSDRMYTAAITYHDDNVIAVEFNGVGYNKYRPVYVVLGTQVVSVPGITVTYERPLISAVEQIPLNNKRQSSQLIRVAIYGKNFGTPSPLVHVVATIAGINCNINFVHVSDTLVKCTMTAGNGANAVVVVTVNGYASNDAEIIGNGNQTNSAVSATVSAVRFDFLSNLQFPGFECAPPNGAVDVINEDVCNCWSGYASEFESGKDCNVRAICPGKTADKISAGAHAPSRPTYKFEADTLIISQTQPIVANRRDTFIEFVTPNIPNRLPNHVPGTPGSTQCMYPGVLWQKKINNLDCQDEFHATMPWSQNEYCGFVEDTSVENLNNHVRKFKTSMVTTYIETYKNAEGKLRFRKMSNSYLLTVSFARQVVVFTTTNVNVFINDPSTSLSIEVRDDAFYDVASHQVIINFETTIAWPYQLDDITLVGTWRRSTSETGHADAVAVLGQQYGDLECTTDQDTDCSQSWILTVSGDACDLRGSIEFSTGTLLCRDLVANDAVNCMFTASTNFTIQIGKTDLCDSAAKDVDATEGLTHSMESFYDVAHNVPQNAFQTGDMVFFQVKLNDPLSSIDAITFNTISLASIGGNSDELYRVVSPGDFPTDATTTVLTTAQVNVTSEIRQPHAVISPGTDAILKFEFRLLRNRLDSLDALSQANAFDYAVSLTLTATVDIWYHGNQKRTVIVGHDTTASTTHASISYYDVEGDVEELPATNDAAAGLVDEEFAFMSAAAPAGAFAAVALCCSVAAAILM